MKGDCVVASYAYRNYSSICGGNIAPYIQLYAPFSTGHLLCLLPDVSSIEVNKGSQNSVCLKGTIAANICCKTAPPRSVDTCRVVAAVIADYRTQATSKGTSGSGDTIRLLQFNRYPSPGSTFRSPTTLPSWSVKRLIVA